MSNNIEDGICISVGVGEFEDGSYRVFVNNGDEHLSYIYISIDQAMTMEVARRIKNIIDEFADSDYTNLLP